MRTISLEQVGLPQTVDLSAIYIHIPFCHSICPFCNFAVYPDKGKAPLEYATLLIREIQDSFRHCQPDPFSIRSVYFGGGTPSRMTTTALNRILETLKKYIPIDQVQVSIEINPEDVTFEYIKSLKVMGFNRVSLGIQSFQEKALKTLSRSHSSNDCRRAIEVLHKVGLENFNLDFLFGYKGQTFKELQQDIDDFLAYLPRHMSAYCLNLERGTRLFEDHSWHSWQTKNENMLIQSYSCLIERLSDAGIGQYEVSNFSCKGYESMQNVLNWQRKNYMGFGLSAHSLIDGKRWSKPNRYKDWKYGVESGKHFIENMESLTPRQELDEEIMVALRKTEKVYFQYFSEQSGIDIFRLWEKKLLLYERKQLVKNESDGFFLTSHGMLLADTISVELCNLLE